eukprot:scaffold19215_cov210-Isochrysis_galbana.AAC.1
MQLIHHGSYLAAMALTYSYSYSYSIAGSSATITTHTKNQYSNVHWNISEVASARTPSFLLRCINASASSSSSWS